nr:hypothetical protein [Tanacetum cinerariifolium]
MVALSGLYAKDHLKASCYAAPKIRLRAVRWGSSFSFPFLVMSKRNLLTITCSLSQSDLVDFVDEYGISLCYDPKLPSSNSTALDAQIGYIPLYLSLFSIGPSLSSSFRGLDFSRAYSNLVGLTDSWEHALSIPSILIDEEGMMAFQNFMKKPGQSPSFSMRRANHHVDVGSAFVGYLTVTVDDDQVESSSYWRGKGVIGYELVAVGEGCSEQDVMAVEGSKKRRSITEALEEKDTMVRPVSKKKKPEGSRQMSVRGSVLPLLVTAPKGVGKHPRVLARYIRNLASGSDSLAPDEAHAAHNMIYGLHCPLLKDKLRFLTFDKLVDIYDIHALQIAVDGNMLINESRFLSQGHSKLKNDLVSLNSKKSLLETRCRSWKVNLPRPKRIRT